MPSKASLAMMAGFAGLGLVVLLVVASSGAEGEQQAARRLRLEDLSLTEQEELRRKQELFNKLDETEQQRMRELHAAISASSNSQRLRDVMLQYHQWLKSLTGKQRADLLKLPPEERIEEINRLMEEQRERRFRDLVRTPLAPEDVRAIFGWLNHYASTHKDELLAMLPEQMRERISRPDVPPVMKVRMLLMALGHRRPNASLPSPTDEDLQKLRDSLSDEAKAALAEVPSRAQKLQLVRQWVKAAVASRMAPQLSRERLLAFYREYRQRTPDKQRVEELDSLPPDEFYEEVRKLYFRNRGHWRSRHEGRDRRDGEQRDGEKRDDEQRDDEQRRDGRHDEKRPGAAPRPGEPAADASAAGGSNTRLREAIGPRQRIGDAIGDRIRNGPRLGPLPRPDGAEPADASSGGR